MRSFLLFLPSSLDFFSPACKENILAMAAESARLKNGFTLGEKLGKGSFGEVYIVFDANGAEYAAKFESRRSKDGKKRRRGPSQLEYESRVYEMLQGCKGIPKVFDFFTSGDYNVLILQKLGRSIQDVVEEQGGSLSMKVVLAIGTRVVKHLSFVHGLGLIHRDLKPQNMMLAADDGSHEVFLIDFGLSKRIIVDGKHIPYLEKGCGLTGTPRYASVSSHMGIEQSRRDDLESLVYIMLYLESGRLPWQGTRGERKERYKAILKKKRTISDAALAEGWPRRFLDFVTTVRSLRFSEKPDYKQLIQYLVEAHDSL